MLRDELQQKIDALVGKPCWSATAEPNTCGDLLLQFGSQIPHPAPASPQSGSGDFTHHSESELSIWCVWRLEWRKTLVCDGDDDDGPMLAGLQRLENRIVLACSLTPPIYDLAVSFEDDLELLVFCDRTDYEWEINDEDSNILVEPWGGLRKS